MSPPVRQTLVLFLYYSFGCLDEKKFGVIGALRKDFAGMGYRILAVDGVKVLDSDGWFLIRPSNTQPQIRLVAEARGEDALRRLESLAEKQLLEKI